MIFNEWWLAYIALGLLAGFMAGMLGIDMPTITYGLRGLAYFEINVWGPKADLHSGLYGGAVHNPAQVLTELIAGMHDEKGRVTLPDFYDSVRPLSPQEHADFARLPSDDAHYLEETGVPALWGEEGYTSAERTGARPTLEVNGLLSGWTGPGSKRPTRSLARIPSNAAGKSASRAPTVR